MNTHHNHRQTTRRTLALHLSWKIFVVSCVLSLVSAPMASAASSWSPTLLVNTESFQIIDSGDGTTNRELRFGDTNTERLIYEIAGQRFRLTRSLHVSGNITATGSLTISGAVILNDAAGDNDVQILGDSDSNLFFTDASTDRVGIGTNTPDTKLDVVGTISGSVITANTLRSSGSLVFEGAASGSSLFLGTSLRGAGLADCDAASQTLQWDATTGRFSCATLTASVSFGSGNVITIGDGRYVNTSGDTMTGALNVNVTGGNNLTMGIESANTISGAVVHANVQLRSSGSLVVEDVSTFNGNLTFGDAIGDTVTVNAGAWTFANDTNFALSGGVNALSFDTDTFSVDATNDRIGIGTTAPKTKLDVLGTISGSALRVSGNAEIFGALTASGRIRTEGNLSGSTLTVDGNLNLRGQTYSFPTSQPSTGGYLRTDGAGNLTWSNNLGYGSGDILSFHPEYPNAIYFGSGSAQVGQLTLSGGTTDLDNSYVWTSSNAAIQDYWISVRVQVPANFNSWDPVAALQFRYKTGAASAAVNHLTVRMKDTAGTDVALTGGSALANTSWTTASITGPASGGTWTPGGYATVYVKVAATNAGNAAAGFLNFRWETRR